MNASTQTPAQLKSLSYRQIARLPDSARGAHMNDLNAAQLAAYVDSAPDNREAFHRSIDAQNTELSRTAAKCFGKLGDALNVELGRSKRRAKGTRKADTLVWECVYDAREGDALIVVTFDVVAGHVRIMRRGFGSADLHTTIDRGLTYAQIAKCADAILNG